MQQENQPEIVEQDKVENQPQINNQVPQSKVYPGLLPQTQYSNVLPVQQPLVSSQIIGTQQRIKGESRIEYVPYEKTIVEYETVTRTEKIPRERKIIEYEEVSRIEYVPKEKKITDYYAVEHQTEYIPQVYQDKYIEYVPQERVVERVEYQALEKQVVHQAVQETQQVQQIVQPVTTYVQQPVMSSQIIQQPFVTQSIVQQPFVQQPITEQVLQQPTTTVQQPLTYSYYQPMQQQNLVRSVAPVKTFGSVLNQPLIAQSVVPVVTKIAQQPPKKQQANLIGYLFDD
eukprot:TRINITY_DN16185_c0_g1_i2.p1 TRINITY_DN16185_c0_g1~~TRINITY_DN16185_c0_g1_i2.p1  ORF type:complete len:286 (-),score=66.57 TRINITY_DN16185_c0_g1_i2:397-1254(-)